MTFAPNGSTPLSQEESEGWSDVGPTWRYRRASPRLIEHRMRLRRGQRLDVLVRLRDPLRQHGLPTPLRRQQRPHLPAVLRARVPGASGLAVDAIAALHDVAFAADEVVDAVEELAELARRIGDGGAMGEVVAPRIAVLRAGDAGRLRDRRACGRGAGS